MKVGILCAGDREAVPVFEMLENVIVSEYAMLQIREGKINGVSVTALFSGVCKVNAAIAAQVLIGQCGCDIIINSGTAGGMDPGLRVFDTVVSIDAAYHDVAPGILTEFHPWLKENVFPADGRLLDLARETAKKWDSSHRVVFGRMLTGEQFIDNSNRETVKAKFAPLSVDMETAAVAHVCYVHRIPWLAVRTITDTPEKQGADIFEKNCREASRLSASFVKEILRQI